MTLRSRVFALFPACIVLLAVACLVRFARAPGPLPLLALAAVVYLVPVLAFRLHDLLWPLREGVSPIASGGYVPWFGAHQLQLLYIALPGLEALLRLVPGLYSAWLRLWGARIGRAVYWTPHVDVLDRSLLDVGDGAVFGHRSGTSGHIITPENGSLSLHVARVRVGARAFVGAGAYLGPGAVLEPGALVRAGEHVRPFRTVKVGEATPRARGGAAEAAAPATA